MWSTTVLKPESFDCRGWGKSIFNSPRITPGLVPRMMTRSASITASSMLCVTRRILLAGKAPACQSFPISLRRFSAVSTSRALKGSSIIRMSGLITNALANPTRCFMPPDNSRGYAPSKPFQPNHAQGLSSGYFRSAGGNIAGVQSKFCVFQHRKPRQQCEALEYHRHSPGFGPINSLPDAKTFPSLAGIRPARIRRSVLFPEPLRPNSATTSPE